MRMMAPIPSIKTDIQIPALQSLLSPLWKSQTVTRVNRNSKRHQSDNSNYYCLFINEKTHIQHKVNALMLNTNNRLCNQLIRTESRTKTFCNYNEKQMETNYLLDEKGIVKTATRTPAATPAQSAALLQNPFFVAGFFWPLFSCSVFFAISVMIN